MTGAQAAACLAGLVFGFALAATLVMPSIRAAPGGLMRTNVRGAPVPAVLGAPLCVGAVGGLEVLVVASLLGWEGARTGQVGSAAALVIVVMGAAGYLDDGRGAEGARGFAGHLRAAARGELTGGFVKLVAGAAGGLAAGVLVTSGWAIVEVALLVALGANLLNLLDRAPGRAGKAAVVIALPMVLAGAPAWALAAGGMLGALAACLPADLGEAAMLGDAGANPLGAMIGLGLGVSLDRPGRVAAIVALVILNGLSEKVSYSSVIERVPPLRALDRLGRHRYK